MLGLLIQRAYSLKIEGTWKNWWCENYTKWLYWEVNNTLIKYDEGWTLVKKLKFMMIAREQNYGITPYTNYKSKGNITKRVERIEEKLPLNLCCEQL